MDDLQPQPNVQQCHSDQAKRRENKHEQMSLAATAIGPVDTCLVLGSQSFDARFCRHRHCASPKSVPLRATWPNGRADWLRSRRLTDEAVGS
jgi:hypothetical protein